MMRTWLPFALAFLLSSIASQAAPVTRAVTASPHRNAPDAFLPLPASNVESVLEQVQSNPVVRRHYARYFHLPQSRVASYLRANLVCSRLTKGGLYTVYFVRPNGLIYPTLLTVPPGGPVFALRGGSPLLTWNEGNPLAKTQKAVRLGVKAPPAPSPAPVIPPPPVQIIVPTKVQTTVVPPAPPPPATDAVPYEPSSPIGR